jgi:hypothetical protein
MLAIKSKIEINKQQVLRNIGYQADAEPPARIMSLIDDYLDNINDLIDPAYYYVIRDILLVYGSTTIIEGPVILKSEVVGRLLERCDKVAVFVVTIGEWLEEMVQNLSREGSVLQASVLDAVGSGAVEALVESVYYRIQRLVNIEGLDTSRRLGPGHCDWDISQQQAVFQVLNEDWDRVQLTPDYLMVPRKSASGIIGIGAVPAVQNYNLCQPCPKQDCPNRS